MGPPSLDAMLYTTYNTISERLQTIFMRRTTAKRRITNVVNRFNKVKNEENARQTVTDLRSDMRNALVIFQDIDCQLSPLLEAAEANALPTDKPATSCTVTEDIIDSEEYTTNAEDVIFEAGRYLENHPAHPSPTLTVTSTSTGSKGHKVSCRPMTHDDCRLWFMQLKDVFSAQGISSQVNKFAALTTLLTEKEAYVVRDLIMLGSERPADVFDAAMALFIKRYELTVHQRLTRALAMGGIETDEKPSQWMARFKQVGGDWTREDGQLTERLLFVSGFLVDCGSAISVLPPTAEDKRCSKPTKHRLTSANGQRLQTFGRRTVNFIFLDQPCSHDMVIADVVHPILGMDFFQDGMGKDCVIDPFKRCLTDSYTLEQFPADTKESPVFSLIPSQCMAHRGVDFDFLWTEFPEVIELSLSRVVTMTTPLHIATDGPPVYTPCRKLHDDKKLQVEAQLRQWEAEHVIERCESNWASPIHAVKKSDGSWRVCGDFRRLNSITKLDRYPLPALTTFNEQLAECTIFSKVDLKHAFQQVCVDESSQDKTAIITTLGLFRFLRMPYGLKNTAQCFQRNVHQLLKYLPFAHSVYMDDIIVGSRNKEDHTGDLRDLTKRAVAKLEVRFADVKMIRVLGLL